jgi:hypothetical protein
MKETGKSLRIGMAARLGFSWQPFARIAIAVSLSLSVIPPASAQNDPASRGDDPHRTRLQQVAQDKGGYAAAIVARWQDAARSSGKWDLHYAVDLFAALMKLGPENLLAAGEATSYEAMTAVLMAGSLAQAPQSLGDFAADLVYTPVTPCRIVDTRNAGGIIAANATRSFDVDNTTSFASQGGFAGPCGIPFNVASAVSMNITVTQPAGAGFLTAWAVGSSQPLASIINFAAGETVANSTVVPVLPGVGNDFNVFAGVSASHVVIDVLGYFAAPVATAVDNNVLHTDTLVAAGASSFDIFSPPCPVGWRLTGGGNVSSSYTSNALIGSRPSDSGVGLISGANVADRWLCQGNNLGQPALTIRCFAVCSRTPGR